jgi:hypothetical protein
MPRAVGQPIRDALWQAHHKEGLDTHALAARFALPTRTVQALLRQARLNGDTMPAAAYHRPAPASCLLADDPVFLQAQALRREHADWGADLVRIVLDEQPSRGEAPKKAPSARTLRRWFAQLGLSAAPPGRRRLPAYRRATCVHQTWQVDATDQVALADGSLASCFRCVDECSGAFLGSRVFPPSVQLRAVPRRTGGHAGAVQHLRAARGDADGQRAALGW